MRYGADFLPRKARGRARKGIAALSGERTTSASSAPRRRRSTRPPCAAPWRSASSPVAGGSS
eukprot:8285053-Alexandrium_andersonii.AAC.1